MNFGDWQTYSRVAEAPFPLGNQLKMMRTLFVSHILRADGAGQVKMELEVQFDMTSKRQVVFNVL